MIDVTRTTSTLLADLQQAAGGAKGEQAWRVVDERYRPIVFHVARRSGLSDADASEVAQDTLTDLFRSLQERRYERTRGRLRQWLLGIARLKIADVKRRVARGPLVSTPEDGGAATDNDTWAAWWDEEERAAVLAQAVQELAASERIEPKTLEAFELAALRGVPAAEVAAQLGMTTQEVYVAKSRCLERVRVIAERIRAAFADD